MKTIMTRLVIIALVVICAIKGHSQLVISEISPNAEVEALEQFGGGEWFEVCNLGQDDMDISGYTVGHYEDASFGQSDYFLGQDNDNCDCGGSYGVIKFIGQNQSGDVILPAGKCLIITGQTVDCGNSYYCINARNLLKDGVSGIVAEYNSSRKDYPGTGNGNGTGALEGHFWRQKNYECNGYYIWNANDVIIDAVNFNCLPQTGPDVLADPKSGGFHYPDGNGGYYAYPPAFPTAPSQGPFPVGIEITNTASTWMGESIEEGFTFQRCSNDPSFVFPPMRYDQTTGEPLDNYYEPTCGELNDNCCTDCDNNKFFQGIQLPGCTNGSSTGLNIEENEFSAEQEVLSSVAPSCNNNESRLRSNYNENEISFCTMITTPASFDRPFIGFVNSLDEVISAHDCSTFTGANVFKTEDCHLEEITNIVSSKGRPVFDLETSQDYTLCFNYDISDCNYKNRIYWDNPCFSPFYCQLDVVCPATIQDTINCIEDLPIAISDTTAFEEVLNGEILSSCDDISISHVDSLGDVSGPKHQKILYRTYTLTDGLDQVECVLEYYVINRTEPTLVLTTDTINLEADGTRSLSPEMFISQAHDICNDTIKSSQIIPDFIDGSNLGSTIVEVIITDTADNSTTEIIDIIVADVTPPTVTCPNDTILQVPSCICEGPFTFSDPPAVDENGGTVTITRLDDTGLMAGDFFPAGTTTIEYNAEDESGNLTYCSYNVTVLSGDPGPIILKDELNFSLSEICDGYPTPAMLIEGTPPCDADSYVVSVLDQNGDRIAEDSLRYFRNTLMTVRLEYACFDNLGETDILIEDKFAPQIVCISDTISCDQIVLFDIPNVSDNCDDEPSIILLNETLQNVSCSDPNLSRIITRTYTSIDDDGRRSDTCFQVLSISKFDLSTVEFNGIDSTFYCGAINAYDENGNPSPSITGYPTAGVLPLWPDQNSICGVTAAYEDTVIPGSSCGYSILRVWNVMYWDCFQDGMRQFFQTINISDDQGPTFTCLDTLRIGIDPMRCSADIDLALPLAQDQCDNGVQFNITYPNQFVENASRIQATLDTGTNDILLEAVDICGNITSCTFTVVVSDLEDPIAIVKGSYAVSLSNDGVEIDADDLDNGSFDECGFVEFTVNRMDTLCNPSDLIPSESINICCEDAGTDVMVLFTVTDGNGNTSQAMVAVVVTDVAPPTLAIDLPDVTVSCDYQYVLGQTQLFGSIATSEADRDTIILAADLVQFSSIPQDGLVLDNCGMSITEEVYDENINITCGIGSITRTFTITDGNNNSIVADQLITFINPAPLTTTDVNWPDNYLITNDACLPNELTPPNLPENARFPVIERDACSDAAHDFLDDIDYGPFVSDTMFIINRQWTIADWCQNENGQFLTFDSTQMITVVNTVEPTIVGGCSEIEECNTSPTCEDKNITISANGIDDCTPAEDLIFLYEIDFNTSGSYDISGNTNSADVAFPIGNHVVRWTIKDAQGNQDLCFQSVIINACQSPTPICLQNQEFSLEAIDTDGDNIPDNEQITITPADIDGGSFTACDNTVLLSFSPNTNHTDTTFSCDDIGTQAIMLYVTDIESGVQDFCQVPIEIIDDNTENICNPVPQVLLITGEIQSAVGKATDDVMVYLDGSDMATQTNDGYFQFPEMDGGPNYALKPELETYPLDGITTIDMIHIQKHILGIKPFTTPYQMLAADVNGSGSINGSDIIELRKLLLGYKADFTNQESWQFIPSNHEFIDMNNPWNNLSDMYPLPAQDGDIKVDYVAVKTGDVNNSSPNLTHDELEVRSSVNMTYELIDRSNEIIIPVTVQDLEDLEGFQFSFRYDYKEFGFKEFIPGKIDISHGFYSTQDSDLGVIDLSWTTYQNRTIDAEEDSNVSFYIVLEKFNSQNLSDLGLHVFSEGIAPQAYLQDGSIKNLHFREKEVQDDQTELFQNKPNPWNRDTKVSFFLPTDQKASLVIYDVTGKEVYKKDGFFAAGMNDITIQANNLGAAGIYYYSLKTVSFQNMMKMILIE